MIYNVKKDLDKCKLKRNGKKLVGKHRSFSVIVMQENPASFEKLLERVSKIVVKIKLKMVHVFGSHKLTRSFASS